MEQPTPKINDLLVAELKMFEEKTKDLKRKELKKKILFFPLVIGIFLIVGSIGLYFLLSYQKILGGTLPTAIKNNDSQVAVSAPVEIEIPYTWASLDDVKKHFSITPNIEGDLSFKTKFLADKKILILSHEKNLKYNTGYAVKISAGFDIGFNKTAPSGLAVNFTTTPRSEGEVIALDALSPKINYNINYYDDGYEIPFVFATNAGSSTITYPLDYTFDARKIDANKLSDYYLDNSDNQTWRQNIIGASTLIDSENLKINEGKNIYSPKISQAGFYFINATPTNPNQKSYSFFLNVAKNIEKINLNIAGDPIKAGADTVLNIKAADSKNSGVKTDVIWKIINQKYATEKIYATGLTTTNDNGEAIIKFTAPEGAGDWVAVASALGTDEKSGEGSLELGKTNGLSFAMTAPEFLRSDDRFNFTAEIKNNSEEKININLELSGEGVDLNKTADVIEINPGENKNTVYSGNVKDATNMKINFTFKDNAGQILNQTTKSISVYSALSLREEIKNGIGSGTENINLGHDFFPVAGSLKISIAASPNAALDDMAKKIISFSGATDCANQIASRIMARAFLAATNQNSSEDMDKLASLQKENGSFSWCDSKEETDATATGYVTEALLVAKKDNADKIKTTYDKLEKYLINNIANLPIEDKVYWTYLLSQANPGSNNKWTDQYANDFLIGENLDTQTQGYIALALYNNHQMDTAKKVLDKILNNIKSDHWEVNDEARMKNNNSATAINLLALVKINYQKEKVDKIIDWLMNNRAEREPVEVLKAIAAAQSISENTLKLNSYGYEVLLNNESIKKEEINNKDYFANLDLPADKIKNSNTLEIKTNGEDKIYWQANLANYEPAQNIKDDAAGLMIARSYDNQNLKNGDTVKIKLNITNRNPRYYLMITDFLPAGFTVVDNPAGAEVKDGQATFFKKYLAPGNYTLEYSAHATASGEFNAPAPRVDLIYTGEKTVNWPSKVLVAPKN